MNRLSGKVALVTGASSGIGRATARLFAKEGAKVVVGARRQKELDSLVDEIHEFGGEARALPGDVCDEFFHKELVHLAVTEFKDLNVAFNNAGTMGTPVTIVDQPLEGWNHIVSTNLTSGFLGAKYQVPQMFEGGGSLIFTSSFVGYRIGFPLQAAYAASKAGLIGLTMSLASEFGAKGVRVNSILPGGTDTAMAAEFGDSAEVREFVMGIHALKRIASPEEISKTVLYLASDESSFTTGTAMLVDGGVSVCKT